ncbi:MAG: carbonic anhydrase family protein [Rhodothermales bacterium]|nr:carbonic anhydrase family protein [Rhodothermales bacterium]
MNPLIRFVRPFPAMLAVAILLAAPASAQQTMTQTQTTQAALTPAEALQMLKEGNERFVNGAMLERDLMAQVAQTAGGQYPFAVVLGCIDSRVPPELVFDQGIGDLFAPRIAGNFVNTDILGSMEFATAVAGSKVIVVLGHTSCGAVKGACDHVEMGNLTHTLSNLAPAVYAVSDEIEGPRDSSNKDFVDAVAHMNVEMTVQNILDRSPVMAGLVEDGELMVVGAMHDVETGRVTFFDVPGADMHGDH